MSGPPLRQVGLALITLGLVIGLAVAVFVSGHGVDLSGIEAGSLRIIPFLLVAGVVDGLNPCAFSTLLVFLGALLVYLEARVSALVSPDLVRRSALSVGLAYTAGLFGVYFLVGLGLFGAGQFIPTAAIPWVLRGSGLLMIAMGLVMVREYFVPDASFRMGIPASLHGLVRRQAHATSMGAAFAGGAVIGLCSVPCSGAVYLGVLSLLTVHGWAEGLTLLLIYNLAFVLPVLVLLFAFTSRRTLLGFTHWYVGFRRYTKLGLGLFIIVMGFLILLLA